MTAVNRGIRFEICYAQVVTGDSERRRNVIANVMAIVRGTRGRGLVVSSGAEGVLNVRPPADVVNLLGVWGLARERGLEAMGVNPRAVVVNEALKRKSFRGVVEIVNAGAAPGRSENVTTTGKAAKGEKGKQKSAGLNSDGTNTPQNNSKRKSEEPLSSGDGTPTMSKRQAKRMRLAMLKSENDGGSSNATTPGTTTPEPSSTIQTKANG
jgi:ribonuclease P/MRP protein subunit RPP1